MQTNFSARTAQLKLSQLIQPAHLVSNSLAPNCDWRELGGRREAGGDVLRGESGAHYSPRCPVGMGSGCSWNLFVPSQIDKEQYIPVIGSVMC